MKNVIRYLLTVALVMFSGIRSFAAETEVEAEPETLKIEQTTCVGEGIPLKKNPSMKLPLTIVITDITDFAKGIRSKLITAEFAGEHYEALAVPSYLVGKEIVLSHRDEASIPPLFQGNFRKNWGLNPSMRLFGKLTIPHVNEIQELSDYRLKCDP